MAPVARKPIGKNSAKFDSRSVFDSTANGTRSQRSELAHCIREGQRPYTQWHEAAVDSKTDGQKLAERQQTPRRRPREHGPKHSSRRRGISARCPFRRC